MPYPFRHVVKRGKHYQVLNQQRRYEGALGILITIKCVEERVKELSLGQKNYVDMSLIGKLGDVYNNSYVPI